jgi:drug/metabolite transporter (DMT)-like permease
MPSANETANPKQPARPTAAQPTPLSLPGLFHLSVVYVVWSSTYLAIRLAVRPGAGFSPFSLAALRALTAMPLLLLWAKVQGKRLWPTRRELPVLVASGILLWTGGNALVVLAEQRIDSALAALIVSSTPIWVALLEIVLDRHWPSPLLLGSILLGFVGTALIAYPSLQAGVRADAVSVVALLLGAFSWGSGSLLQRRRPLELDPVASAAWQLLFGGVGVALLALMFRESLPHPTPSAWLGFAFLLIFGSLLAFTSFIKALRLLHTRLVFTYAYVNPVLAAFLGWLVLGERLAGHTVAGAALVLTGVAGIFRTKH